MRNDVSKAEGWVLPVFIIHTWVGELGKEAPRGTPPLPLVLTRCCY